MLLPWSSLSWRALQQSLPGPCPFLQGHSAAPAWHSRQQGEVQHSSALLENSQSALKAFVVGYRGVSARRE